MRKRRTPGTRMHTTPSPGVEQKSSSSSIRAPRSAPTSAPALSVGPIRPIRRRCRGRRHAARGATRRSYARVVQCRSFRIPPRLGSGFDDLTLRAFLRRVVPPEVERNITPSLAAMGELAAGPLAELSRRHRLDEPRHVPFDAWGNRVDRIEVTPPGNELARVAAEEGLVGVAYERQNGAFSRMHQFATRAPARAVVDVYSCPLAMTDGAARTLAHAAARAARAGTAAADVVAIRHEPGRAVSG